MGKHKWIWLSAALIMIVPYLLLSLAAFIWLYEQGWLWIWLLIGVSCSVISWSMIRWLRREQVTTTGRAPRNPLAPKARQEAEAAVEEIAQRLEQHPEQIDRMESIWPVLREVLEAVARAYYPRSDQPALETPAPQVLRIVELVAADLRHEMNERIPAAHAVTLNDLQRLNRLSTLARQLYTIYRIGAFILSPQTAIVREMRDHISGESFSVASQEARRWATGFAVRRAGDYAIQLYSGEMVFNDLAAEERVTSRSKKELRDDDRRHQAESSEPLRVLVIGQTKAGKSSLINALFGKTVAAVGPAPLTDEVTAYRLERSGSLEGLVLDSPGYEVAGKNPFKQREVLLREIETCDLVLLVCAATSAAREADRAMLDRMRELFAESPQRTPPALLVVLTHIDLLRPRTEWSPPYNVVEPTSAKEQTIRDCMEAIAADLGVPTERVTPVCLAEGQEYNVQDGLAAAIAASLDDAQRSKYFRCLSDLRDAEFWRRLGEQAKSSGKLLAQIGVRWLGEAGRRIDDWSRPLTK